ncbi:MAG TPA: hypothetical protein VH619_19120 [Verrucomicrobiae bacterium]|nr:hypothetical protein [Verrucomicrobiae bacterium]
MVRTTKFAKCAAVWTAVIFSLTCNGSAPPRIYQGGFSVALKLGGELFESLPPRFSRQLDRQAIALQPQDTPIVTPIATTEDSRVLRQVSVSAGFIDLANHICHAKAADRVEPGFFDRYVKNLARETLADPNAPIPPIVDARFWTDQVITEQLSYFNQMIGFVMAINLSHHYLGHYAKYSTAMMGPANTLVPINDFLTPAEWHVSVREAVTDELNCALATDGPRALLEAIDEMPRRPGWTDYVIPPNIDIKKLAKELSHYEIDFFHGRLSQ